MVRAVAAPRPTVAVTVRRVVREFFLSALSLVVVRLLMVALQGVGVREAPGTRRLAGRARSGRARGTKLNEC
ncbi:hypothetical protein GCM10009603_21300 [Nocardiopsis exhalans]